MLFVDTGAWFAQSVPSDPDYDRAIEIVKTIREPLVTTDYVVDELLTLFAVRGEKDKGIDWLNDVMQAGGVRLARVEPSDFDAAISIYRSFLDKLWSFTDCTSYAVIQRLGIQRAFSFDAHFQQFGIVQIVP